MSEAAWLEPLRRPPAVLVVGDVMLDEWLSGRCERLAREGPVPVVDVQHRRSAPGGAGNAAVNLAALGARPRLVAAVGDDAAGHQLLAGLTSAGVDVSAVTVVAGRRTMTKRRVLAGEQLLVRVDDGDTGPVAHPAAELVARLGAEVARCQAVLVCDYGLGLVDEALVEALRRLRAVIPLLVVDAHDLARLAPLRADVSTPNAEEVERVLGVVLPQAGEERAALLERDAEAVLSHTGAQSVVVTLDRDGALLLRHGDPAYRTWAQPAAVSQTTGAGDTFVAALTLAATAGMPWTAAVEVAQAAADVVVRRPGTVACTAEQLQRRLQRDRDAALSREGLAAQVAEHRSVGRRVVFTNGCFDVLHRGHVAYLNQAKRQGDVLVVGVNSDASVARLKGPDRPVNPAADRCAVLAGLSCVDHVTVFDEDTPAELLRLLQPEVYAKGGDYTAQMLSETEVVEAYGGQVRILDYVADHSTAAVIDRIRSAPAAGRQ